MHATPTPSTPPTRYRAEPAAWPDAQDAVLSLWQHHSAMGTGAGHKLAWGYRDNPAGPGHCVLLHADGEPASHRAPIGVIALHERRWWRGEQTVRAAALADFVVNPTHRTLGPAVILMRAALASAQAQALVYGLPNDNSRAVAARVGMAPLHTMPRRGKLLRGAFLLQRRGLPWRGSLRSSVTAPLDAALAGIDLLGASTEGRGLCWQQADFGDAAIDELWSQRDDGLWMAERSSRCLAWRFGQPAGPGPAALSPWLLSIARTAEGAPRGYVVWRVSQDLVELGDFLCPQPRQRLPQLLHSFARHMRRSSRATALSLEVAGGEALSTALTRAGFIAHGDGTAVVGRLTGALAGTTPGDTWFTSFDRDPDV
jgi:hypothetical protein